MVSHASDHPHYGASHRVRRPYFIWKKKTPMAKKLFHLEKKMENGANLCLENRVIIDEIREYGYVLTPERIVLKP